MRHWTALVGMLVLFGAGCEDAGDDDTAGAEPSGDDDAVDWLPDQEDEIGACGGYELEGDALSAYCAHEIIEWTYDADAGELWMLDNRIPLNCCGRNTMQAAVLSPGELYVLEGDEMVDARCACDCLYDYAVTARGVPDTVTTLTVERWISDSALCSGTVWAGPIDLAAGAGTIVIEDPICGDNERLAADCEQGCCG